MSSSGRTDEVKSSSESFNPAGDLFQFALFQLERRINIVTSKVNEYKKILAEKKKKGADTKSRENRLFYFQEIISKVSKYVEAAKAKQDFHCLQQAVDAINNAQIHTSWFQAPTTVKEMLATSTVSKKKLSDTEAYLEDLRSIRSELLKFTTPAPVWSYHFDFSKDNDQSLSQAVGLWEDDQMKLQSENASFVDFDRDFRVTGQEMSGWEKDLIKDYIDKFVEESSYSETEKKLLKIWLANNGGQSNSSLGLFLLKEKGFVPSVDSGVRTVDWFLNEKGHICFNCNVGFAVLQDCSNNTLLMLDSGTNKAEHFDSPNERFESLTAAAKTKDNSIVRIIYRLELDFIQKDEELLVRPNLVAASLVSHTNQLRAPQSDGRMMYVPEGSRSPKI